MIKDTVLPFLPSSTVLLLAILGLFVVHRFILRAHVASTGKKFRNQVIMAGLTALGVLFVLLTLPLKDELLGQILTLLGILLSAAIALSSTTLLGNAMAGFMIRAVHAFRLGEFIRVGDHFGRVSDTGLFHTEIQTEDRDLETLPNLMLVSNAVRRVRPSGTIVSATVSLGYDVPHGQVELHLVAAAQTSGLEDPFVRILELTDHAVVYKVAGFLPEVKQLLAVRSSLRAAVLDRLHAARIEIVSPAFRNTRLVAEDRRFIPQTLQAGSPSTPPPATEHVVFDKAEEAASLESLRTAFKDLEKRRDGLRAAAKQDAGAPLKQEQEIAQLDQRLEHLSKVIEARESHAAEKE